ncbi:MAG: hypothetical protein HY376_02040 [Candidatus Blackburnbacteria bacterium]|nr:hypothetical protein [Candidatus Blackburnbacteria bacterium]
MAKREAKRSNMKYRHGAVIYDKHGRIIAYGHNYMYSKQITLMVTKKLNVLRVWSVHSEMDALRKLTSSQLRQDLYLFVYREYKDGTPALSRPCDDCFGVIDRFGIKHVDYTRSEVER